jgi:uncharacterized protein YebE (UPF0316 family)
MIDLTSFATSGLFQWVVLPVFIFVARGLDVGLSTLRIASIAQGRSLVAAAIGFFEALLWLAVITQILRNLQNPACIVAWAGGFAAGNLVGLYLERRLAMGMQVVRIITQRAADELVTALAAAGFGVTVVDAQGVKEPVRLLFTVVRRRDVPRVLEIARSCHPRAFFSVEDVRQAGEGVIPGARRPIGGIPFWQLWRGLRKMK